MKILLYALVLAVIALALIGASGSTIIAGPSDGADLRAAGAHPSGWTWDDR